MLRTIITAGPTYEPLDQVRRLTNHSTGRLGTELANHLVSNGIDVTILRGYYTTFQGLTPSARHLDFTTTESLAAALSELAAETHYDAVFHAAAVSDFRFGNISNKGLPSGTSKPQGKIPTRSGSLTVDLVPTKKILRELRGLFPRTFLAGWKYEVDGDRESTLAKCQHQLQENHTDISIANGPAYGEGFGIIARSGEAQHVRDRAMLYDTLLSLLRGFPNKATDR